MSIFGSETKASRPTKAKEKAKIREFDTTKSNVAIAFRNVDIQSLISEYENLKKDEYKEELAINLRSYFPWQLDAYNETREYWMESLRVCNAKFPTLLTVTKPQSFEDQDNNINKYFGNSWGNQQRLFIYNMARHYAGNNYLLFE